MNSFTLTAWLLSLTYAGVGIAQTCNPSITADAPNSRYFLNAKGTAIDKKTGLTWMRCSVGQTWDGSTCIGSPQTYSWKYALETAESTVFADKSDWRLPNQKELQSLIENRCFNPAINLTAFPNTGSDWFWSSSPNAISSYNAWVVKFSDGYDGYGFKSAGYAVRLVRGGQSL